MPASTYRSRGEHVPVVSASAALVGGTFAFQEGFYGIVITGCAIGKSTQLDCFGVHMIAVPASTVKGDKLYATLAVGGDVYPVTIKRAFTAGDLLIGQAQGDRDAVTGLGLVKLAPQPAPASL